MVAGIIQHDPDTFIECRLLIAHPDRARVLAVRNHSWTLPVLTPLEQHPSVVGHINHATRRLFGFHTFVRRLVSEQSESHGYTAVQRLYELEVVSQLARQRIERTAWAGRTVLPEMEFGDEQDRSKIEAWIADYESESNVAEPGPEMPPWCRPGWFEIASTWMRRNATGSDHIGKSIPHQHWTDNKSTVLTADSEYGQVVLIAAREDDHMDVASPASRFGWEPPELITEDTARHWSLFRTRDRAEVGSVGVAGGAG